MFSSVECGQHNYLVRTVRKRNEMHVKCGQDAVDGGGASFPADGPAVEL